MTTLSNKMKAAMPFAHLLGIKAKRAEDEDKRKDDEEARKARRAESDDSDDGDDEDEDDKPKSRRAEDDEDQDEKDMGDDDGDDEDGDDKPKSRKKARRAEDDEDKEQAVRQSERARCAAIIAHGIQHACVRQAGIFAFDTGMNARQAIAALNASLQDAGGKRGGLAERMAAVQVPHVGSDAGLPGDSPTAVAAQIVAAHKKALGAF